MGLPTLKTGRTELTVRSQKRKEERKRLHLCFERHDGLGIREDRPHFVHDLPEETLGRNQANP
jgi:hypothetical protein